MLGCCTCLASPLDQDHLSLNARPADLDSRPSALSSRPSSLTPHCHVQLLLWLLPFSLLCLSMLQGLDKIENRQKFPEQYNMWQNNPSQFIIDGHAPVRCACCARCHPALQWRPSAMHGAGGGMAVQGAALLCRAVP